jgi:GTP-binding protein HflX
VSDTVGFIRKLPTELVASFAATLAEAGDADVLLHVVDSSDGEESAHRQVTDELLNKVESKKEKKAHRLLLYNKSDLIEEKRREELKKQHPEAMFVSTQSPGDMQGVARKVMDLLDEGMIRKVKAKKNINKCLAE